MKNLHRRLSAVLVLALLAGFVGLGLLSEGASGQEPSEVDGPGELDPDSEAPRADVPVTFGIYRYASHVATFNIYGGRGNAYENFNTEIAKSSSNNNTVQTQMLDRGTYLHAIGLQEVCQTQYDAIRINVFNQDPAPANLKFRFDYFPALVPAMNIGTSRDLHPSCGAWYGNAVFVRGSVSGSGKEAFDAQGGERRGWVCITSYLSMCTAHMQANDSTKAKLQNKESRAISDFVDGSNGSINTFSGADFNLTPENSAGWRYEWYGKGWLEADRDNPFEGTTDRPCPAVCSERTYDYIWREPGTWAHDAYIVNHNESDHHWKQGYI